MKSILLSAGFGSRLRPLTDRIPKCLVPVLGKPLIEYWLDMLCRANVVPILVNLHYLSHKVKDYIRQSPYNEYINMVYEEKLFGTGGTILKNRDFFDDERFMMIHCDNLSVFDMDAFIAAHNSRPSMCDITMMTFEADNPASCGIVELDDSNVVRGFYEKVNNPPGRLANGAVYIIEPSVFKFLSGLGKDEIDFSTEVLPEYIGRIYTFHNSVYHRDIGTIESYNKAETEFLRFKRKK